MLIPFKSADSGQNMTYYFELRMCVAWVPLLIFAFTDTFLPIRRGSFAFITTPDP